MSSDKTTAAGGPRRPRRTMIGALVAGVVLLAVLAAGAVWFLAGDAPAAVDLASAVDQADADDSEQAVTAGFDLTFADYDVATPTAPIVVSVADVGTVELQLFLTQA